MLRRTDLLVRQTIIVRQGNRRLKPKLGLPVGTLHVNVYPGLFAREKVKPKAAIAEYCGAHGGPIAGKSSVWHITMRLSDAGLRQRQTKAVYPDHRSPPWLTEDATRDRSNRLLGVASRRTHVLVKVSAVIVEILDEHRSILGDEIFNRLVLGAAQLVSGVQSARGYPRVEARD